MSTRRLTTAGAIVEFLKRQFVERDGASVLAGDSANQKAGLKRMSSVSATPNP